VTFMVQFIRFRRGVPEVVRVPSGLAPPLLANKGLGGYRPASHEGGGQGCGAWTVGRKP